MPESPVAKLIFMQWFHETESKVYVFNIYASAKTLHHTKSRG